jgi:methylmalonyl-CoA/ethylmalonyl-CoA epimerase
VDRHPSALQEFLDESGEGVHHLAYLSDDVKGAVAELTARGVEVLTSANLDTGGFAYVRFQPTGMVVEIRARFVQD